MGSLKNELEAALEKDKRVLSPEGRLLKNKISELAIAKDELLLEMLLSNSTLKEHFFHQVGQCLIFDLERFLLFVSSESFLLNSYTSFKSSIGLSFSGKFLKENQEVVLDFPYKDCILEGGMTVEESQVNEVFYNRTLAPDEITRIMEPKKLTNFTLNSAKGEKALKTLEIDERGALSENLFVKGNNLLVLSSLRVRYMGKVKLIYIDPPYNTRGADDSFKYNDRFNHSTWLTFMKNRLEIAKELLAPDGVIYVQLDYNEVHYCKVLMDEIFGRQNFQREIIWRIGWVSGYKTIEKNWIRNHDSILFYAKNRDLMNFKKQYIKYPDGYVRRDGAKPSGNGYAIEDTWNCYGVDTLSDYANDELDSIAIKSFSNEKVGKFKGQKNEALIKRIIEAHTDEGDLVLDFFGGSGTTAAVAHKLKRKWILVEQIESQVDIAKERLSAMMAGAQTGISREVDWKGGGSYVSAELANLNENFAKKIKGIKSKTESLIVWEEMKISPFLNYRVSTESFSELFQDFEALSLKDQKVILSDCLDLNALYQNYADIDDRSFETTTTDRKLNDQFYGSSS